MSIAIYKVILWCPWSEPPPTKPPVEEDLEEEEESEELFEEDATEDEVKVDPVTEVERVEVDLWTKGMDDWAAQQSCGSGIGQTWGTLPLLLVLLRTVSVLVA